MASLPDLSGLSLVCRDVEPMGAFNQIPQRVLKRGPPKGPGYKEVPRDRFVSNEGAQEAFPLQLAEDVFDAMFNTNSMLPRHWAKQGVLLLDGSNLFFPRGDINPNAKVLVQMSQLKGRAKVPIIVVLNYATWNQVQSKPEIYKLFAESLGRFVPVANRDNFNVGIVVLSVRTCKNPQDKNCLVRVVQNNTCYHRYTLTNNGNLVTNADKYGPDAPSLNPAAPAEFTTIPEHLNCEFDDVFLSMIGELIDRDQGKYNDKYGRSVEYNLVSNDRFVRKTPQEIARALANLSAVNREFSIEVFRAQFAGSGTEPITGFWD